MPRLDDRLAREARIAFEKFREYFKQNIDLYHTMHTFVLGQQWTAEEEDDMIKTFRKVPLASNKLGTMANALLGEQQQNTPQLQVVPMQGCDQKVASIRETITKDIMLSTDAAAVYQTAASQAAIGGYGAFALGTEYAHSHSFDLDIVYRHFKDATRCYWDIGAEHINKIDGMHCGYYIRMTREKFREKHGSEVEEDVLQTFSITQTKEEIALAVQPDEANDPFNWADSESITIINHFKRKYVKDALYKLSNGKVLNQEEMDGLVEKSRKTTQSNQMLQLEQLMNPQPMMPQEQQPMLPVPQEMQPQEILPESKEMTIFAPKKGEMDMEVPMETGQEEEIETLWDEGVPVRIEEKRSIEKCKIMHYQIAGNYILDESEFPSEDLPLIFVDQNSYYDKTGKQITRSFFGDCKDTQRYINYLRTQSAYILKVSRYDQWIGSKKNVASLDTRRNWSDPQAMQGLLAYDESPSGAKPEPIKPPELSQSLFQQYQLAIEDLYTSTGLYPARMGNNGDEASGKAIDARTRQGSYPTFVFFNSINRAIAAGGTVLNQMIPRVYDSERVFTLMMPDEGMKNIVVNRQMDEYSGKVENDIRRGTYEVRLKPGPSYEGQKQEALMSLQQVLQASPETFNLIADLYADNLPLPNTIEIKNRLKTLVSPAIIEAGKTGQMPQKQQGPNPEQQAVAIQQQQLQLEAQYKQAQIDLRREELALKEKQMQVDLEIERQKLQAEEMRVLGEIEEGKMRFMAETDRTESDHAISHANNLVKILTHKVM